MISSFLETCYSLERQCLTSIKERLPTLNLPRWRCHPQDTAVETDQLRSTPTTAEAHVGTPSTTRSRQFIPVDLAKQRDAPRLSRQHHSSLEQP